MDFVINHTPMTQPRPRLTEGRFYDPASQAKKKLKWLISSQMAKNDFKAYTSGYLCVDLTLCFPTRDRSTQAKQTVFTAIQYHNKKPDIDNCAKLYLDVMNKIVYRDDSMVSELHVKKIYAKEGIVRIRVTELVNEDNKDEPEEDNK